MPATLPYGSDQSETLVFAHSIAMRLIAVPGVVAVSLGGSHARGVARPDSDLDFGVYYDAAAPPALADLQTLATELDDRHPSAPLTAFGGWGPWINGGGWLTIGSQRVDWLYRDLARVEAVSAECRAGRSSLHHQPGHPHGFHSHIYLGEIAVGLPLADPYDRLAHLKALATPYPPALRQALIRDYLWQAGFALEIARKPAARLDVGYVAGCLFECVADLVQVLYALNERYFLNEKGAIADIAHFALRPDHWQQTVEAVLARPGATAAQLVASVSRLGALRAEVATLATSTLPEVESA